MPLRRALFWIDGNLGFGFNAAVSGEGQKGPGWDKPKLASLGQGVDPSFRRMHALFSVYNEMLIVCGLI